MTEELKPIPTIQKVIAIVWPSFLVAAVATVLVFALFDPKELVRNSANPAATRMAIYTISFFCFWALGAASSMLTCYFRRHCHDCEPKADNAGSK